MLLDSSMVDEVEDINMVRKSKITSFLLGDAPQQKHPNI